MTKDLEKKKYNNENKNRIREIIVNEIRKRNLNSIVTLESPDFLFSKLLPDKKIIVFEKDSKTHTKLEKNAPKNVEIIFGNINKIEIFNSIQDVIYADFTGAWESEQNNIIKLKNQLKTTKLFILTLCMRYNKKLNQRFKGDYQFDLINKIQEITNINWKVVYGESYYDGVQMVSIILENNFL